MKVKSRCALEIYLFGRIWRVMRIFHDSWLGPLCTKKKDVQFKNV